MNLSLHIINSPPEPHLQGNQKWNRKSLSNTQQILSKRGKGDKDDNNKMKEKTDNNKSWIMKANFLKQAMQTSTIISRQ
jgi:hypothetical protein